MRVVIFGTGAYYEKYKRYFHDVTIVALLDNSSDKIGQEMDGVKVHKPIDVLAMDYDRIYVLSSYFQEMTKQLMDMGIRRENIFYFYDIAALDYSHKLSVNLDYVKELKKPRVAVISHDFKLSGAQSVLVDAVSSLVRTGYSVVVASPMHGKMETYLHNMNVPVVIDERITFGTLSDMEWLSDFSMIIVNTMHFFHLLLKRDKSVPVLLWSHEPKEFYEDKYTEKFMEIAEENLHVYAVSNVARNAWNEYSNKMDVGILTIGRKEIGVQSHHSEKEKFIFLMVGAIGRVKGQDIVCNALEYLPQDELDKIEIHIAGRIEENHDISYLRKWEEQGVIKVVGEMFSEELEKEYRQCDVLICASKMEALSAVVIEAGQHQKASIVSSIAGITDYLEDMENAIIFPSEDSMALSQKMLWCIHNRELVKEIGTRARQVYESHFTMDIFERNLLHIIDKILKHENTQ